MSDTLKPCPFCGSPPVLRKMVEEYPADADHPAGEYEAWFHIACDQCGFDLGDEYRSGAIAAWNRRASLREVEARKPQEWVSVDERMPEPGTECIVWCREVVPGFGPYAKIDTWDEQREAPVGWSSVTVPIGFGWNDSDYEDVTHWRALPPPPAHGIQSDGKESA